MLRGIDPLLTPELLKILREMGHGDEIAIVDANYPAATDARRLVRLPGASATEALRAILTLLPVDTYVDHAAQVMAVVGAPDRTEPIMTESAPAANALHTSPPVVMPPSVMMGT